MACPCDAAEGCSWHLGGGFCDHAWFVRGFGVLGVGMVLAHFFYVSCERMAAMLISLFSQLIAGKCIKYHKSKGFKYCLVELIEVSLV